MAGIEVFLVRMILILAGIGVFLAWIGVFLVRKAPFLVWIGVARTKVWVYLEGFAAVKEGEAGYWAFGDGADADVFGVGGLTEDVGEIEGYRTGEMGGDLGVEGVSADLIFEEIEEAMEDEVGHVRVSAIS